jgi:hypothetical protein
MSEGSGVSYRQILHKLSGTARKMATWELQYGHAREGRQRENE